MRNVLIIGSTGFIGKALVERLKNQANLFEFNSKDGEIYDPNSLKRFDDKNIDHVFHLAAKTFVPDSWVDPADFYKVNFMGTLTALEFCRLNNCRLTLLSSYLYGKPQYLPIDESHPLQAFNPYGQSKLFAELNSQFYKENFSVPLTIFRLFNAYGPQQADHFLIPTILNQIMDENCSEVIVKDLLPKRDYVFIDDIIDALVISITGEPGTYNLASGHSISVEDIIEILMKKANVIKPYLSTEETRQNEVMDLYGDISRAKTVLNWQPKVQIEEGLGRCVNFLSATN